MVIPNLHLEHMCFNNSISLPEFLTLPFARPYPLPSPNSVARDGGGSSPPWADAVTSRRASCAGACAALPAPQGVAEAPRSLPLPLSLSLLSSPSLSLSLPLSVPLSLSQSLSVSLSLSQSLLVSLSLSQSLSVSLSLSLSRLAKVSTRCNINVCVAYKTRPRTPV